MKKLPSVDVEEHSHAICSASSSERWLNCPPSARLQLRFPNNTSIFAEEGTFVHELCEYKLKSYYFDEDLKKPYHEIYYSQEAEQNSDIFANLVIEEEKRMTNDHGKTLVLIERKLYFSNIVPEGFGTGDAVLISPEEIHIFDYKNGKGVFVEVNKNTQMMLYALGAINMYDADYDFKKVQMTIVQPNLNNIKAFEMTKNELVAWGKKIKPIAKQAYLGEGETNPGEWCTFCKARYVCRERMEYQKERG